MLVAKLEKGSFRRFKSPLIWIPLLYILRWLRLTPLLAFVLFFTMYVLPYVASGPFWSGIVSTELFGIRGEGGCEQTWWTVILYLRNFLPDDKGGAKCYQVTWYLSVDFQIYLLVPIIAYVAYKFKHNICNRRHKTSNTKRNTDVNHEIENASSTTTPTAMRSTIPEIVDTKDTGKC